jgi:CDP-glycerol glycerophosphotransferase (TagB/SpsB family)
LSGYYQKPTKEIFLYERRLYRHLVQVGDNEVRKLRYRIETNKFKAMINIKENAVICLGYPDYASFKNSTGLKMEFSTYNNHLSISNSEDGFMVATLEERLCM